ncbi:hypothetical protein D3C72_2486320 [compost metagenome]
MAAHQAGIHAALTGPYGTERRDNGYGRVGVGKLYQRSRDTAGLLQHLAYQMGIRGFEAGIAHF